MKTANVLHVVKCSVQGCEKDALVTKPSPANSVKGYCMNHLTELAFMQYNVDTLMADVAQYLQNGGTNAGHLH